jgi:hypothetical protein
MRSFTEVRGIFIAQNQNRFSAFTWVVVQLLSNLFRTRTDAEKCGKNLPQEKPMVEQPRLKHFEITDKILNAFFKWVYPALGYGFLEKVYRNSLSIALREDGLSIDVEFPIMVYFEGHLVGEYFADLW